MPQKGKIILIEGTDGSGKKTQSVKLTERLNSIGFLAERMAFPRYHTPTGRIISQCYLGKKRDPGEGDVAWFGDPDKINPKVISMLYAADRLSAKEEMIEILSSGKHLILDRYVESNMAHQGGKETDSRKRTQMFEFVYKLEYGLLQLPRPDLTLFLYMPHEIGRELKKKSGEETDGHEANKKHLERAEEAYLELARRFSWPTIECALDGTIRGLRNPEDIHEEIFSISRNFLSS